MSDASARDLAVAGLQDACTKYGAPLERTLEYMVTQDTWRYWEMARRKRTAEVVLAIQRKGVRYLVHTKGFYPPGTYRLPSGGIKPGEDLQAAVLRETWEETSLAATISGFLGILHHRFLYGGQPQPFTSYLFLLRAEEGRPHVNDADEAITDFREVDAAGMADLITQLETLPPDWVDWGRFRASAHRLLIELVADDRG